MKKLIILGLFVIAVSCSKSSNVAPVYTSIEGTWKFSGSTISGEFYVIKNSGAYYVDGKGDFIINNLQHNIVTPMSIDIQNTNNSNYCWMTLKASPIGSYTPYISFNYGLCNSTWSTISCNHWAYNEGTSVTIESTDQITITRVK